MTKWVSERVHIINSLTTTRLIMNSKLHIGSKWQEARVMESEFQLPPTFSECITYNLEYISENGEWIHSLHPPGAATVLQAFLFNFRKVTFIYNFQQKGQALWKVRQFLNTPELTHHDNHRINFSSTNNTDMMCLAMTSWGLTTPILNMLYNTFRFTWNVSGSIITLPSTICYINTKLNLLKLPYHMCHPFIV